MLLPREAFVDFNEDNPSLGDLLEFVAPRFAEDTGPTWATYEPKTSRFAIRIIEMGFDEVITTLPKCCADLFPDIVLTPRAARRDIAVGF